MNEDQAKIIAMRIVLGVALLSGVLLVIAFGYYIEWCDSIDKDNAGVDAGDAGIESLPTMYVIDTDSSPQLAVELPRGREIRLYMGMIGLIVDPGPYRFLSEGQKCELREKSIIEILGEMDDDKWVVRYLFDRTRDRHPLGECDNRSALIIEWGDLRANLVKQHGSLARKKKLDDLLQKAREIAGKEDL